MSALQFSVIIVAYNNWWLTRRCLEAFAALRRAAELSFETIVIDNASHDETPDGMQEFPWVRYVRNESNTNFAGGANQGARLAQAPVLLFVNNDAVPLDDAVAKLVRAMEDERVAIAGGCAIFEDGPVQGADAVVLPAGDWWLSYRNLPADLPEVRAPRDVLGVAGAMMAIDTAWYESIGGFDETYTNGYEDLEMFMRARQMGRIIRYVPDAITRHYESAAPNREQRDDRNARLFYTRWRNDIAVVPRTFRGEISSIAIRIGTTVERDVALHCALRDLVVGLEKYDRPIVYGSVFPRNIFDHRFRMCATLDWFPDRPASRYGTGTVAITGGNGLAQQRTFGCLDVTVPWLPCALPEVGERSAYFSDGDTAGVVAEIHDVFDLRNGRQRIDVAVLSGLTDPCAYGNLALAHAGVPVVIVDGPGVRNVYSDDTAFIATRETLRERVAYAVAHPDIRRRTAERMRADAQRRFTPWRAAMRFNDLARAACRGLQRPGKRESDTPIPLEEM